MKKLHKFKYEVINLHISFVFRGKESNHTSFTFIRFITAKLVAQDLGCICWYKRVLHVASS